MGSGKGENRLFVEPIEPWTSLRPNRRIESELPGYVAWQSRPKSRVGPDRLHRDNGREYRPNQISPSILLEKPVLVRSTDLKARVLVTLQRQACACLRCVDAADTAAYCAERDRYRLGFPSAAVLEFLSATARARFVAPHLRELTADGL
jgi:hypothetical protein